MGKLLIKGLSDSDGDRLRSKWRLQEGAIFDIDYPGEFVKRNVSQRELGFPIKKTLISLKYDKLRPVADVVLEIQR